MRESFCPCCGMREQFCPCCGDVGFFMGTLADLAHFRCRSCGVEFSMPSEDVLMHAFGEPDEED